MRIGETERSIQEGTRGAVELGKGGGSDYQPPKRKSPWKVQIIGALVGLVVFIIAGIMFFLLHSFH